jgi:CheY-like chemotaxis protein
MRILVVDDDPAVAEVIAEAIRARGDAALVSLDGTEALDILGTTPIDGVFLDLVMPGLGGLATLTRIRNQHPGIPVVISPAMPTRIRREKRWPSGRWRSSRSRPPSPT